MPTVDVSISAGADDGYIFGGSSMTNNIGETYVGNNGSGAVHCFLRFVSVTIPQGATINTARLDIIRQTASGTITNVESRIFAADEDNPATVSSYANYIARPLTTASTEFDPVAPWTHNSALSLPDIAAVIQEIVDRAGWVSGNALMILWMDEGTSGNHMAVHAAFENSSEEPHLVVDYTEAAPPPPPGPAGSSNRIGGTGAIRKPPRLAR